MIIKLLLIASALGLGVLMLRERIPGDKVLWRRIGGMLGVAAAVVAVLWPILTTKIANAVGVTRGADLVFYALAMSFVYYAIATSQRIHQLEHKILTLTRELALAQRTVGDGVSAAISEAEPSAE